MNLLTREEIIDIVSKLQNGGYGTAEEADRSVELLKRGVTDPHITDYIFFDDLTPEEVADKALSYKPIML